MSTSRVPLKISSIYAVMGFIWVVYSDRAVIAMVGDAEQVIKLSTLKGCIYVVLTTLLLYLMLKRETDRRNSMEENLSQLVNIVKSSQDAIIGKTLEGTITSWNQGAEKLYGYKSSEIIGKHITTIFPKNKHRLILVILSKIKLDEVVDNFQTVTVSKDGSSVYVSITISPIKNIKGEVVGASSIAADITRQKEDERRLQENYEELSAVYEQLSAAEEELRAQYDELQYNQAIIRESEERYKLALEGANDVIWEWKLETNEFFVSDKWQELTGYSSRETLKAPEAVKLLVKQEDRINVLKSIKAHIRGIDDYYQSEFRIVTKQGEEKWVFNRGKVLKNEKGKPSLMAGSMTDITDRKKREEQIRIMAYFDSLSGLPNRLLFMERLEDELEKAKKNKAKGAVLFLDLDDFKRINDTLGHDYGDELLKVIGENLLNCVKSQDTVARFGGDEFLILQPNVDGYAAAAEIATRILNMFNSVFRIRDKQVYVTASLGLAVYPDDGCDANTILKNIDTAMYNAKANGKNRYCFFDKSIGDAVVRKTELEKGLREALFKKELFLQYQPQVDVMTGRVTGLEALLRWNSREFGRVSPAEFIPIAEATGLIIPIGEWVMQTACKQCREWKEKGYDFDIVSVNVSSIQLQQEDFIKRVGIILAETGVEISAFEIEITESILMNSLDENVRLLSSLKEMGIKTALDDFGTGYSSLSYLRRLPISTLKIDKSFIDNICNDAQDKSITDGIIQLAHKIGLDVIVEGVENEMQVNLLKEMECNVIQGYYFSKPLPVEQAEDLLKNRSCKL